MSSSLNSKPECPSLLFSTSFVNLDILNHNAMINNGPNVYQKELQNSEMHFEMSDKE